jgi:hypothetical protein
MTQEALTEEIFGNAMDDYCTCAAFYQWSSEAMSRRGSKESAEGYGNISTQLLSFAVSLGLATKTEEMALKVTQAKFVMASDSMRAEIQNKLTNFSILMNRHLKPCQEMVQNPTQVVERWSKTINARYGVTD